MILGSAAEGVMSGCNLIESLTVLAIAAGWHKDTEVAGRVSMRGGETSAMRDVEVPLSQPPPCCT